MIKRKTYSTPLEQAYDTLRKKLDVMGDRFNVPKTDMEDMIQEGYLRLADNDIKKEKEALGKLWVTIRNLSIDRFRKNKKESFFPIESLNDLSGESHNRLDYDFLRLQMKALLSPLQYEIMNLLIVKDLDYSEIAACLKISENAVRTHVCRARKILKEKLEV